MGNKKIEKPSWETLYSDPTGASGSKSIEQGLWMSALSILDFK